ncbi:hypothetical protein [Streptomyces palmae]|uniref:Uncharacterized protein n=1 Tax=Streptomyces palmae TaxID=1701085 RepID=A0A4Z0H0G1_9ACTN|nr:hypothetical protein [Streptomyces palmae]TGB03093.1 hypothetical protein E4099_20055 [Streptomyces palmae]
MLTETVCVALSAGGLAIAMMTAYRRRFLSAARIAAYALIPIGLAMTGILGWIEDLVFHPSVWLGFVLLGVSWLLLTATRAVERRRQGGRGKLPEGAAGRPVNGGRPSRESRGRSGRKPASDGDDFSDIEAILKKHGI